MFDYSKLTSPEDVQGLVGFIKESKESKEDPNKSDSKDGRAIKDDREVIYADLKREFVCLFKNIIVFTNDKSDDNKTLKNLRDAIKGQQDIKLHLFLADEVDIVESDEGEIRVFDSDEEVIIDKQNNLDTLVISRLSVQGELACEHAVQILQDRGFLVLNPVRYSALACNKYETAKLLEKADIPQPRFCSMDKSTLYDEELYTEAIKKLYPKFDMQNKDAQKEMDVVIKILDGHGGTGVFLSSLDKAYAILQTIFAVSPETQLIIQKKEEADGGDIRVHVLTLRNKQIILAAMKRVKIGGDFRSNVSLGATAEKVKLTPEQEQIALQTALVSKLPWCAVDIMPLVKGSNKELGDNVVLEINASPGTAGITEVIGRNFMEILLSELDDPSEFMLQDKIAGYVEACTVDFGNTRKEYLAKLDTGNSTHASTLEVGEITVGGTKPQEIKVGDMVEFKVNGKKLKYKIEDKIRAYAGEEVYERPVIVVPEISIGHRKLKSVRIAIIESRGKKTTNLLLCRDHLNQLGYVIHPGAMHILTPEMEKVKII